MGLAWYENRYINPALKYFEILSSALLYETGESTTTKKAEFYESIKASLKKSSGLKPSVPTMLSVLKMDSDIVVEH